MRLIRREAYLSRLAEVEGTPDIKVVTGVRRCGKSKLLEAFARDVCERDPSANVIQVNFNLAEFEPLMEWRALHEHIEERYIKGAANYVFIDEVQMCEGFERAVNSLHASERYDIYLTGSSAFLMSSDLATLFTGRTFSVPVYPFSLSEFMEYYELEDPGEAIGRYALEGGMPGSYAYRTNEARYSYVADVFDTLIVRDIRQKHGIRNVDALDRVSDFLMDNVSNVTSAKSIADFLGATGSKVDDKTVGSYLGYLCDAFAFYKMRRYDTRGKRYLSSGNKYYLADHSFRYAKLGTRNMDYGRVYENMVAIELMRRGYEVYAGMLYEKEIDFVAMRRSEKVYIQVSDSISDPVTFERECAPLLAVRDAYPKLIIANTHHGTYAYEGIEVHDLATWLTASEQGSQSLRP